MENITITKKTLKPFKGQEGKEIPYAWYKGVRQRDGVTVEFGSKNTEHAVGDFVENISLEKSELSGGRFRYKEVVSE